MIKQFTDQYQFLSNFYPCDIEYNGVLYNSLECAYMSTKSDDLEWKEFCRNNPPNKVKTKSKQFGIIDDNVRLKVMRELVYKKFDISKLSMMLLDTGYEYIQEGNMWGDEFWGVNLKTNKGLNHLGILLMEKRFSLQCSNLERIN